MRLNMMKWTVGLVMASLIAGCASSEVVPASGPRAAVQPSVVKIYQTPPKKYEKHGLVEVSVTGEVSWSEKGDATAGFERLKAQAANKGANGILLSIDKKDFTIAVTAAHNGTFYQVPIRENPRTAVAEAIYVIEE